MQMHEIKLRGEITLDMTTRPRESVAGKEKEKRGLSPLGSSSSTERRRSLRPLTPPGTGVAKHHGKGPAASSSSAGEKHVPNYLKPTISSKPDVAKHTVVKKQAKDDTHKPTPTMMRRRSFDRPVPASQVQKAVQSSSARGGRVTPPFSPKHSVGVTRSASSLSSSERISKVVKAVKSQPPLLKTNSMPRTSSSSGIKKEVKLSNLTKAAPSKEEEPVHPPSAIESEAEDHESLDLNVEEELAKLESPVDLPPEQHFAEDKEHIDEENHSPKEHVDANEEKEDSTDITIAEDHHDGHGHPPEPTAENAENVKVSHEETQVVHESHHTDESDQQSNQAVDEAPAEHDVQEEEEKEKETEEEIKPVGLTVKTTLDENDGVAAEEGSGHHDSGGDEIQKSIGEDKNEAEHKMDKEEKPTGSESEKVVHKRQVGGPRNKESPAYNDVIEETASKLVGKRVNKVRALAGAFETVISLQQPDSS